MEKENKILNFSIYIRPLIIGFSGGLGYWFFKELVEVSLFPFFVLFLCSLFISFIFHLARRKGEPLPFIGFIADILLVTAILNFTGGPESAFFLLYFLIIILSSLLLKKENSFYILVLVMVFYNLFLFLWIKGWIKPVYPGDINLNMAVLRSYMFNLSLIFVFILAHILSERAKVSEKKVEEINFIAQKILENLGEIVIVKDKNKVLYSNIDNRNIDTLLRFSEKRREINFNGRVYFLNKGFIKREKGKLEVYVFKDITKEREMEEYIRQKEKDRFLSELSAGLAHEIRNPLASLKGAFTTVRRIQDQNRRDKLLEIIGEEIQRLEDIVNEFVKYAKLGNIKKKRVPFEIFTEEIVRESGIENVEINSKGNFLEADPSLYRIAISNIIKNAFEAVQGDKSKIKAVIGVEEGQKKVEIIDKGEGMDEELLSKVKIPFFTTKPRGMGMGLALVERIVNLHNGKFIIESEKGKGTRVVLYFP